MATGNIFTAFARVAAICRTEFPANKSAGRDGLYNSLLALLDAQQVLCIPRTQHHSFEIINPKAGEAKGLTTVRAEFDFIAPDGSMLTAGAVGVHCSEELVLTNILVSSAQRQALIGIFLLPATIAVPVATATAQASPDPPGRAQQVVAETNKVKGGVARMLTADQLEPGPTPSQRTAATKAMTEWRSEIQQLDRENPNEWYVHWAKLNSLPLLKPQNREDLFNELVEAASLVYIGFDATANKFYLAEMPATA
jgi:hypothetical protein